MMIIWFRLIAKLLMAHKKENKRFRVQKRRLQQFSCSFTLHLFFQMFFDHFRDFVVAVVRCKHQRRIAVRILRFSIWFNSASSSSARCCFLLFAVAVGLFLTAAAVACFFGAGFCWFGFFGILFVFVVSWVEKYDFFWCQNRKMNENVEVCFFFKSKKRSMKRKINNDRKNQVLSLLAQET